MTWKMLSKLIIYVYPVYSDVFCFLFLHRNICQNIVLLLKYAAESLLLINFNKFLAGTRAELLWLCQLPAHFKTIVFCDKQQTNICANKLWAYFCFVSVLFMQTTCLIFISHFDTWYKKDLLLNMAIWHRKRMQEHSLWREFEQQRCLFRQKQKSF